MPRPTWHLHAKCRHTDHPTNWDSDRAKRTCDRTVMYVLQCEGCPVVRECAAAALEDHSVGVVVAGVPLPIWTWWTGRRPFARCLEDIAGGMLPHVAVAIHLCSSPQWRPARDALLSRVGVLYAQGALPRYEGAGA